MVEIEKKRVDWIKDMQFEEGRIESFGRRHILIDSESFYRIREGLKKIVGSSADRILYMAGKEHIEHFGKRVIERSMLAKVAVKFDWGKKKMAEKLVQMFTQYGYGVGKIEKFNLKGKSILVVENSVIGELYEGKADSPTCAYMAGLLAGGTTALAGKNIDCIEVECIGKGDNVCKFVFEPSEKE